MLNLEKYQNKKLSLNRMGLLSFVFVNAYKLTTSEYVKMGVNRYCPHYLYLHEIINLPLIACDYPAI